MKTAYKNIFYVLLTVLFICLIFISPQKLSEAVYGSVLLCAKTVIPSLFPVCVCVTVLGEYLSLIFYKGGEKAQVFAVFFLSLLGGYPVGVKLLSEKLKQGKISPDTAKTSALFCFGAGPGFVITAIGIGEFSSFKAGLILYLSHILPSVFTAGFLIRKIKPESKIKQKPLEEPFFVYFTNAVLTSAKAMFTACSFIIVFSPFYSLITRMPFRAVLPFLEITNGVMGKSIHFVSFLLGFGGICVICQILSIGRNIKIDIKKFFFIRILNGLLSSALTFLLLRVFKISINTVSAKAFLTAQSVLMPKTAFFSFLVMFILLIMSVNAKNNGGNLSEDLVK